jgi:hypothetical protein
VDDAEKWLSMYETSIPPKRRWGNHEDLLMIESMPDFGTKAPGEDSVRWYQRTRALEVDGVAGPKTRRALITEYMAADHTSLKAPRAFDINVTTHGCGENFPLDESGGLDAAPADGQEDAGDRRVELFFFDREFGVRPPPPGKNSKKGSTEYPAWRKAAVISHDLDAAHEEGLVLEFADDFSDVLPADVVLSAKQGDTKQEFAWTAGVVDGAFRRFVFDKITWGEAVTLEASSSENKKKLSLWNEQVVNDPAVFPVWEHVLEELAVAGEPDGALETGEAVPASSDAEFRAITGTDLFDF